MARQAVLAYNPLRTMVLNRSSPVPLYFQLAQHIENEIRLGNLVSGIDSRMRSRSPRNSGCLDRPCAPRSATWSTGIWSFAVAVRAPW